MSADSRMIQSMIDSAPTHIGVYAKTIELEPREYEIDETITVNKGVRIVGNNTVIRATVENLTMFRVEFQTPRVRFEQLRLVGWSPNPEPADEFYFPERGGIGLDIRTGRGIVDNCHFQTLRIGLFLHSREEEGTTDHWNADEWMVRDCDFTFCIYGLWTNGWAGAQTSTIMNCRFEACRKAITEQSAFGNHYISNYLLDCPRVDDPKCSEGYGIRVKNLRVPPGEVEGVTNYSTFTSNWPEAANVEVNHLCTTTGGYMVAAVRAGDRIGQGMSALKFRGGRNNPVDYLSIGGDEPSSTQPRPNGAIALLQRDSDVYSYMMLSYCSADPSNPDPLCPEPKDQGWKLRQWYGTSHPFWTELLRPFSEKEWELSNTNGAAEADKCIPANSLNGKTTVEVTFNLQGYTFGGGDDEASLVFVQNGDWRAANVIVNGGQNGLNGAQTITIPITSFHKVGDAGVVLDPNQPVTNLHARFWRNAAFRVTITSVQVL